MTRTARRLGRADLVRVVAVGRSPRALPYAAELTRAGAAIAYSRESDGTRPPGPPTADEIGPLLTGDQVAYVCGSSRFAEFGEALLIQCGVPMEAIRVEQFGATG
jgi:ferredoxin-NADP reductase